MCWAAISAAAATSEEWEGRGEEKGAVETLLECGTDASFMRSMSLIDSSMPKWDAKWVQPTAGSDS